MIFLRIRGKIIRTVLYCAVLHTTVLTNRGTFTCAVPTSELGPEGLSVRV